MKQRLCLVIGLAVALIIASAQPAFAKDVSGGIDDGNPKAVKANKYYTYEFESVGDRDSFSFISAGGEYKIDLNDLSGRAPITGDDYDGHLVNADGSSGGIVITYQYGSVDKSHVFTLCGFINSDEGPSIDPILEEPGYYYDWIELGKIKKGTKVKFEFEGDYAGAYQFQVYGKDTPIKLTSSNMAITVKDALYTGKKVKPSVTLKYDGKKLAEGTDYGVSYRNAKGKIVTVPKALGTYKVIITGKGLFKGTIKKVFKVRRKGAIRILSIGTVNSFKEQVFGGAGGNDAKMMYKLFTMNKLYGYKVSTKKSRDLKTIDGAPTREQIDTWIKNTFGSSKKGDLCYFFFAGHGVVDAEGTPLGIQTLATKKYKAQHYSYEDLVKTLNKYCKGHVFMFMGSCNSGGFVEAAHGKSKFTVISGCGATEELGDYNARSNGLLDTGINRLFYFIKEGLTARFDYPADADQNRIVTTDELFAYASDHVIYNSNSASNPECWASDGENEVVFQY